MVQRVVLSAIVAAACGQRSPQPAPESARLASFVSALHARGEFDGALVVSDRAGIVYAGAFGLANREANVPHTVATPVDGASLAKPFTAALVLALVAEGRLDLDAPIGRYLPTLTMPVTLRQLLTHTSGLPHDYGWFEQRMPATEVRTAARFVELIAADPQPLELTPGSRFEYSSPGYDLAALVAERVTGRSYPELLASRFFTPLGMRDSFVRPARLDAFPGVRTRGYRRRDGRIEPFDALDLEGFAGGSNIYLSARDLDRWNRAWLDHPPLPARAVELGTAPVQLADGTAALSLLSLYRAGTWAWYVGYHQGFRSVMWRDHASGLSIVFVTNHAIPPHVQTGLVGAVLAIRAGRDPAPAIADGAASLGPEPGLAGTWDVDGIGTVAIERDGAHWFVRSASGVRYPMFRVEPTYFYAPGLDAWVGLADGTLIWRTTCQAARGTRRALPDLAR